MPIFKIKGGAYENVDEVSLDLRSAALQDGYVDELNNTVKRPALDVWVDDSADDGSTGLGANAVQGLFYWAAASFVVALANGKAYQVNSNASTAAATTNAIGTTKPAIWAGGNWGGSDELFVATGAKIGYFGGIDIDNADKMVDDAMTSEPETVTHVAQLNGYIICNNTSTGNEQRFYYSNGSTTPNHLTFSDGNLATAEARPDKIVALHNFWNELYLFGSEVCEVWHDDGVTPFSRIPGAIIETGCSAPYSIVNAGGTIWWLDDKRRFVKLAGRITKTVSNPFQKVLDNTPAVFDAIAYPLSVGGRNWIILNFPSADPDFSLCYDYELDQWARWGDWDGTSYTRFKGSCAAYIAPGTVKTTSSDTDDTSTTTSDSTVGTRSWTNPTNAGDGNAATEATVTNA